MAYCRRHRKSIRKRKRNFVKNGKINGGIDNAGRVAVLDLGMEYKPLGMQLDQAQFIETQKFGINEVAKYTEYRRISWRSWIVQRTLTPKQ